MAAGEGEHIVRNSLDVSGPKTGEPGAIFVLKSQGSWWHCGYHMTTAIVAPVLLTLPYAFALLGWIGGALCLSLGGIVTFYSYNLLSIVLEHFAKLGLRQLRFRDMAVDILGPGWGRYLVSPLQLVICCGAVISLILLNGQSLKYIYVMLSSHGRMELHHFIMISGAFTMVMAQMPSFHSLRHINLVSLMLCIAYSACATIGAVYIGYSRNAPMKDYSIPGTGVGRVFGFFNAFSVIATTYGNGMIPEIQATIAPPVTGKMLKGLLLCYSVVISTFFSVAISGYWAFGNQSQASSILANFIDRGTPLLPRWFLLLINVFTLAQTSACCLVYLQPINVVLENVFSDPKKGGFSSRNTVPRLLSRSLAVAVATLLAAMLPFFGDIQALIGAFGIIPLDFILPMVFYNVTFKDSRRGLVYWVNVIIGVGSAALAAIGAVASVRQLVLDSGKYRLFANL